MKWYVTALFILLAFTGVWIFGYQSNQIKYLRNQAKDKDTAIKYLEIENEAIIASLKTEPDTIIKWYPVIKQGRTDTVLITQSGDTVPIVTLSDSISDSNLTMYYVSDVCGYIEKMSLGYRLKAPRVYRIPEPYPVETIKEVYPRWGMDIVGVMQPNDYAAGVQFRTGNRLGFGIQYWFQARAPGISLSYRLK